MWQEYNLNNHPLIIKLLSAWIWVSCICMNRVMNPSTSRRKNKRKRIESLWSDCRPLSEIRIYLLSRRSNVYITIKDSVFKFFTYTCRISRFEILFLHSWYELGLLSWWSFLTFFPISSSMTNESYQNYGLR